MKRPAPMELSCLVSEKEKEIPRHDKEIPILAEIMTLGGWVYAAYGPEVSIDLDDGEYEQY